ncbi:hypothetical protein RhiirB3_396662, partial [Rhizophagus irregularis]
MVILCQRKGGEPKECPRRSPSTQETRNARESQRKPEGSSRQSAGEPPHGSRLQQDAMAGCNGRTRRTARSRRERTARREETSRKGATEVGRGHKTMQIKGATFDFASTPRAARAQSGLSGTRTGSAGQALAQAGGRRTRTPGAPSAGQK